MELHFTVDGKQFQTFGEPVDLSIPMKFSGEQPSAFGVLPAVAVPYETDGFIGDKSRGGSVNCFVTTLTPHGNGTHTECVGHITDKGETLLKHLRDVLVPCSVVSVKLEKGSQTRETYAVPIQPEDLVVTRASLEAKYGEIPFGFEKAIVVRTTQHRGNAFTSYTAETSAYFSIEAMRYLVDRGVEHLLLDGPSVDRLEDEGRLWAHHMYWGLDSALSESRKFATITEFVFAPAEIEDGTYLLNLQVAPFELDAAPSRPILFPVREV